MTNFRLVCVPQNGPFREKPQKNIDKPEAISITHITASKQRKKAMITGGRRH